MIFALQCHDFTLQCHDLVLEPLNSVIKRHDFERLCFNYELLTLLIRHLSIFIRLSMIECLYSTFPLSQWTPV